MCQTAVKMRKKEKKTKMDYLANESLIPAMNAVLVEHCIINAWMSLMQKYYQKVTTVPFNYYRVQRNMKGLDRRHKFPRLGVRAAQQQPPLSRLCLDSVQYSVYSTRHRELTTLTLTRAST